MAGPGRSDLREGYAIFLIAGKEYGVNVKILSLIIDPLRTYSFVKSFNINSESIKFENQEIPLIDIYSVFKTKPPPQSKETRLLIVTTGEQEKAAFFVEKVKEFITFDFKNTTCLDYSNDPGAEYLKWQLTYDDRDILIPDFDKILSEINQS